MLTGYLTLFAPLGVSSLFSIINARADIWLLTLLTVDRTVGIYNAAYKLIDICAIVAVVATGPLIPIFSRVARDSASSMQTLAARSHEMVAVMALPVVILFPLISEWIIRLVYGDEYIESVRILNWLTPLMALVMFSMVSSLVNLSVGAIKHAYWSGGVVAGINIALKLWWIPLYGALGAATASVISTAIWLGISAAYTIRAVGNVFDTTRWITIVVLNLALAAAVWWPAEPRSLIAVILAAAVYAAAVATLGLVPIKYMAATLGPRPSA